MLFICENNYPKNKISLIQLFLRKLTMDSLILDHIALDIEGKRILNNITFEAKHGRIHSVLGPNGAGKTITNKVIALLYRASSGSIHINGNQINPWNNETDRTNFIRNIGLMWQNPVFLNTSIENNLAYPLKLRKYPKEKIKDQVDLWIERIEFNEYIGKKPNQLSIGQKQRLSLARTLITNPQVIILDEPTASLDNSTTKWLENYILSTVKKLDLVAIWNSHDLFQVRRVADDVSILFQGAIVETNTKNKIFSSPKSNEVEKFINGDLI